MIRRILCLALAAGLLLCLTAAPEQALAETYVPLPELLLFRQDNVQKDLGAQRKECRTYPGTANEQVNALVSQAVAENEEAFYTILMGIGTAYTVIMLIIGIMQIHNYSMGKTLVTLFITLVAVLIIIFLALLVINFITQVYTFFRSIYTELIFRF